MKKQIVITYEWNDEVNNNEIDFSQYHEQLEEDAMAAIYLRLQEGYTNGELDSYGEEDCIEFTGCWSIDSKTIEG